MNKTKIVALALFASTGFSTFAAQTSTPPWNVSATTRASAFVGEYKLDTAGPNTCWEADATARYRFAMNDQNLEKNFNSHYSTDPNVQILSLDFERLYSYNNSWGEAWDFSSFPGIEISGIKDSTIGVDISSQSNIYPLEESLSSLVLSRQLVMSSGGKGAGITLILVTLNGLSLDSVTPKDVSQVFVKYQMFIEILDSQGRVEELKEAQTCSFQRTN